MTNSANDSIINCRDIFCLAALAMCMFRVDLAVAHPTHDSADVRVETTDSARGMVTRDLVQASIVVQQGVRSTFDSDTQHSLLNISPTVALGAEIRLVSVFGLRGGIILDRAPRYSRSIMRLGGALHVLRGNCPADPYAFVDLSWVVVPQEMMLRTSSREITVGVGFRGRIADHMVIGVEVAGVQEGIEPDAWMLKPTAAVRAKAGARFLPQVTFQIGVLF
jgi:hypothetical protein